MHHGERNECAEVEQSAVGAERQRKHHAQEESAQSVAHDGMAGRGEALDEFMGCVLMLMMVLVTATLCIAVVCVRLVCFAVSSPRNRQTDEDEERTQNGFAILLK